MILYPYSSAFILTDELFSRYGGNPDASPYDLRQAAYQIAESAVYYDLETPLQLTTFTGTYAWSLNLLVDHTYVRNVVQATILDAQENSLMVMSGTTHFHLDSPELGLVRFTPQAYSYCHSLFPLGPLRAQIVYQAGLSSGTSYDQRILIAMTQYAMIQINEMVGYGNESPGDIGVQKYSNQEYTEERIGLLRTGYGNSAKANYIHNILSPFRKRRYVGW